MIESSVRLSWGRGEAIEFSEVVQGTIVAVESRRASGRKGVSSKERQLEKGISSKGRQLEARALHV